MVPLRHLRSAARNSRTHPKRQIEQIAESIRRFGYLDPVLIDENWTIIGGHARAEAAKLAGLHEIPAIAISGLDETRKRALALALNKIPANSGWNRDMLALELRELESLLPDYGLDLGITGFEPAEIETLMGDLIEPEQNPHDEVPEIAQEAVSRRADLWELGQHRLLCGDARDESNVRKLMGRERAAMVFADPPYNVRISSVQGRGKIKHREFLAASGEMRPAEYAKFLTDSLGLAAKFSINGAIHFVCTDWRHLEEMSAAGRQVFSELKNLVVWAKTNGGQGTFYRSQHELIFAFKVGDGSHINNFELGQHGRNRSNLWTYAGVNTFRAGRLDDLSLHPTVKPIALVADAMRDCSRRGDIVLDPFLGSGTTILAAERVGRRGYALELDPIYVDVSIRRWQAFTRRDAILRSTRQTFDEIAATRSKRPSAP
jgi:DNA modification methylase